MIDCPSYVWALMAAESKMGSAVACGEFRSQVPDYLFEYHVD